MRHILTTLLVFTACIANAQVARPATAPAQNTAVWSLQRTVQYAVEHNISIQQTELNNRLAALTLRQSELSQLPNVNLNSGFGRSFGRSVDPTTNQYNNDAYNFFSASGNFDVLVFGWFSKRRTIEKNGFNLQASGADLDQLKDDVSLNVATGYLRALLAMEQIRVNEKQIDLSKEQLTQTQKFVEAGRLPELNVAQLQSQLANDSANLITSIANFNSTILDLKALLNLDFGTPFQVQAPVVDMAMLIDVSKLNPSQIYAEATRHFGSIRSSNFRLQGSEKAVEAAEGTLYPSLSLTSQAGTNYATSFKEIGNVIVTGQAPNGSYVVLPNNAISAVYSPTYDYDMNQIPFGEQVDNNLRYNVSLGLNIPIFNAWQSQYNLRQAKISLMSEQLKRYETELKLKQDVYKAYNDALSAVQKYNAAERAVVAAQRAFVFAQKRYDLGLTNTVEYLTTQNNQFVAESSMLSAKYDLIFKLKVIDYYLGKELKL